MRLSEYEDALSYLYSLERFGVKLGLDTMEDVMKIVGNPHHGAKGVHIAGTNGKGSVAAMISSILRKSGYRTGTYTSPHLLRFEERIAVDGKPMNSHKLMEYIGRYREIVKDLNETGVYPTFFEITTAIAFEHFRDNSDVWVIETGMGGRLDATNIVKFRTGVITTIGRDHTKHLGNSLPKIAGEKAGIIKEEMNIVTGERRDTLSVIEKRAKDVGAEVFTLGRDIEVKVLSSTIEGVEARIRGIYDEYDILVPLAGRHQADNAALAIAAAELMRHDGIFAEKSAIISGIRGTEWRGRFEIVSKDPLAIMDAAHNPHGAEALKETLVDTGLWGKYTLLIGMLDDKDAEAFAATLVKGAKKTVVTEPRYRPRAMKMEELITITSKYGDSEGIKDVGEAVDTALGYGNPVLITGSIYLLGDILSEYDFDKMRIKNIN